MNEIINLKDKGKSVDRFVNHVEFGTQVILLTKKITAAMQMVNKIQEEVNAFIGSYNTSIREQNKTNIEFARLIQGNRNAIEQLKCKRKDADT